MCIKHEDLISLIKNGENSSVEFKREDLSPDTLSKEMVALSNLSGGRILIGVDDDQSIVGINRPDLEEWVMNIARHNVFPPIIPHFEKIEDFVDGKSISIVTVPPSPSKPCRAVLKNHKVAYIRVGSTIREPSDEELLQMLQANQRLNFGKIPLPGAAINTLYLKRIRQYFEHILRYDPHCSESEMLQTMHNLEFVQMNSSETLATVNGMLLFGKQPKKFLFQSGIRAIVYKGNVESYEVIEDATLDDPLTPELDADGRVAEYGLIERAIHFIGKHCSPHNGALREARNFHTSEFSEELLRELIVNSVIHRDYTISGADILLSIFSDRLEIRTPGRLPNGGTIESLKKGFRYYRNQTLVNTMRDYGYVDARGMGIRLKIIPQTLALTGKEPDFNATDTDLTVTIPRVIK